MSGVENCEFVCGLRFLVEGFVVGVFVSSVWGVLGNLGSCSLGGFGWRRLGSGVECLGFFW